jgi:hypothetical protein
MYVIAKDKFIPFPGYLPLLSKKPAPIGNWFEIYYTYVAVFALGTSLPSSLYL